MVEGTVWGKEIAVDICVSFWRFWGSSTVDNGCLEPVPDNPLIAGLRGAVGWMRL